MTRETVHQESDIDRHRGAETFVVGGGHLGYDIARRLVARKTTVTLIDSMSLSRTPRALDVHHVDALDSRALSPIGRADEPIVLLVDDSDGTNMLLAQHARTRFDTDRILVRVNDPRRLDAFEDLGVDIVDGPATLGRTIVDERL
ncbi:NAD-binding protein [Halanaeroarchaeum sulfurireducens]|uniref:TrkA-N domain family protein n=1 Tax=Halanaeroarchaeum sulfurireducens TaxID=1604004 RepID=A0A0F7P9R5_9EURY|nr:NAD-binding protein [Halanaeroarchaeum sulfurireducens]AKH97886.1 TrkA-N domain family protein [Halanaeroarchaeum sulfurireducens]ALG82280.1 TrkA-N domain family protein [Halanaeroarchaeum sulfurireducens]